MTATPHRSPTSRKVVAVAGPTVALALALSACGSAKNASTSAPAHTSATTMGPATTVGPASSGTSGNSNSTTTMGSQTGVTVSAVMNPALGTMVLVGPDGHTLYTRTTDTATTTTCTGTCAQVWPPLLVNGPANVGAGLSASLLGQLNRPGGGVQATYAGHPLYYYSGDSGPDQAHGEGVGHIWYAVSPSGSLVMGASTSGSPSTTAYGNGGGYGGGYGGY